MNDENDWREVLGLRSPTEDRNPRTTGIDQLPATDVVNLVLSEDRGVVAAVEAAAGPLGRLVDRAVGALVEGGRIHYVGSGTSGRLAVLDAAELRPTYDVGEESVRAYLAGGPDAMVNSAEGAEDDDAAGHRLGRHFAPQDLVVGLTASGRTPFVAGALRAGHENGAATALISTNPDAPLADDTDIAILLDTGPEVITGSTRMRAATAQKIALNTFSTAVMVRMGKTFSNLMIEVRATNKKLQARTVRMLVQATGQDAGRCAEVLTAAGGHVRTALVALMSGQTAEAAERALADFPPDPARIDDPAGVRTAVAALRSGG
ncbi:N-acetylmuramic acid 6-phosphate etherase [Georgenia halophila]|uniref:N-acetylmuramic acid 6-phosphate etherase n=1 Tax=Georgenia halophila TaxID=620889 RepID=A0ABP8L5A2_9MICO